MWTAMSPSPPTVPGTNNNNSRHVYVHHINERQAPQYAQPPPPQPMFMPMPMPYPQPQPMPMFMGGMGMGMGGYGFHQQPQPPVIVINGGDQKPDQKKGGGSKPGDGSGGGDVEKGKGGKDDKGGKTDGGNGDGNDKGPRSFSSVLLVSIILVLIGSLLGFICVGKVYDVFEHSMKGDSGSDYFIVNRQLALGMGAFATLCYCIAFMLAFYAGMKYKMKSTKKEKKQCCRDGLLIAAWVIFCLTSVNNLIILILAFDEEARIYPEVALTAVIGSIVAWVCIFWWAELTRRSR